MHLANSSTDGSGCTVVQAVASSTQIRVRRFPDLGYGNSIYYEYSKD